VRVFRVNESQKVIRFAFRDVPEDLHHGVSLRQGNPQKSAQLTSSLKIRTSKSSRFPNLMFRIAWYGEGHYQCSLPTDLDHPYRFSIHLVASESLIFPRYR
jgi:hypothetical protein